MGCCVQVTAGAITGRLGRTARGSAREMLTRGLVHFVASDAHDVRHRPPALSGAYAAVRDGWGEEVARALFEENPRAALEGVPLQVAVRPPAPRPWYRFW